MSSSRKRQGSKTARTDRRGVATAGGGARRTWLMLGGGVLLAVAAVVLVLGVFSGGSTTSTGTVVQGNGGHWTNIAPARLASMMTAKDFTLLNVKTPYIGEIQGTDLYIPYDQLVARKAELPANRTAPIVVYCRTGNESAIAAQTLLDLGYTTIYNLDGGMTAWTASGRPIVQLNRG